MNRKETNKKWLWKQLLATPLLFLVLPVLNIDDLNILGKLDESRFSPQSTIVVSTALSTQSWEIDNGQATFGPFVIYSHKIPDQIEPIVEKVLEKEPEPVPSVDQESVQIDTTQSSLAEPLSFLFKIFKGIFSYFSIVTYAEDDIEPVISSPYLEYSSFVPEEREVSESEKGELSFTLSASEEGSMTIYTSYDETGTVWTERETLFLNGEQKKKHTLELRRTGEILKNLRVRFEYRGPLPQEEIKIEDVLLNLKISAIENREEPIEIPALPQVKEDKSPVTLPVPEDLTLSRDNLSLSFPKDLKEPLTIVPEESTIPSFSMQILSFSTSTLTQSTTSLFYLDAYPSVDLEYQTTETALKEYLHLKDRQHPNSFKYSANLDAFDVVQVSPNKINLYKKGYSGSPLFLLYTLSAPEMTDANGSRSTDISLSYQVNTLTLTPSELWLEAAAYPVILDPTVEIQVLNLHSHPTTGESWGIDFTTLGTADLTVTPADQATIEDDEFTALFCGEEDRTANVQVLPGDILFYENWNCDQVATLSHMTLKAGSHHLIFDFGGVQAEAFNAAYTWDGGGGDALWSTDANWSSNVEPTSGDTVTFDNTCVSNCSPTIDADVTIAGMTIASTYAGTITQGDGNDLVINGNFSQAGGTFKGGVATTSYSSEGGTFTISGGTYLAATTTIFYGADGTLTINIPTTLNFYHLKFHGVESNGNVTITTGDTLTASGTISFLSNSNSSIRVLGGTIEAWGDLLTNNSTVSQSSGTTVVDFANDSVTQTWTVTSGFGPIVRFNSGSDANDSVVFAGTGGFSGATTTSAFSGTIPFSNPSNYEISIGSQGWYQAAGTFNLGPANLSLIVGNFNLSGGTFNGGTATTTYIPFDTSFVISGGTYNAASTTVFNKTNGNAGFNIDVNSSQTFHNLTIQGFSNGSFSTISSGDTLITTGLLYFFTSGVNNFNLMGGTIKARGNIVTNKYVDAYDGGTTVVDFDDDSLAQTWTILSGFGPTVRFDSAADASDSIVFSGAGGFYGATTTSSFSGTIQFSNPSNYEVRIANGGWYQAAGTFNLGAANMTISVGNFNLSGGTFNGGTATTTHIPFDTTFLISGGTYNAASTTVFSKSNGNAGLNINVNSSQTFHNLTIQGTSNGSASTISSGDTLITTGLLYFVSSGGQNFNLSGGTFEARGDVRINMSGSGSSFSPSLLFSGSSSSGLANQTFNLTDDTDDYDGDITINKTEGEVQLLSALVVDTASQDLTITEGTLNINGQNLTISGSSGIFPVQDGGTFKLQGGETLTINSGYPTFAGSSTAEYTSSGSVTLKDWDYRNLYLSGSGTFTSLAGTLDVAGNLSKVSGNTFSHNSGTVRLNGTDQTIAGSFTFNNLYKYASSSATLTHQAGATSTVAGTLALQGSENELLSLRSGTTGSYWYIDPQGSRSIAYLDVKDSYNSNATDINAQNTNSETSGNNVNWVFDSTFDQGEYRIYENNDNLIPLTSLGSLSATTTIYSTTTPLRLRISTEVGEYEVPAYTQAFILQVATPTFNWVSVASSTGIGYSTSVWLDTSLPYRRKIIFDNTDSSVNLTNFPVLVNLKESLSNIDYSKTQNSGQDIRFTDSDGVTALNYEIEKWDETATSTVWVKVPQIDSGSATDYIWMYYGDTSTTSAATTTGVWDDHYVGVWHLGETSGTNIEDSSRFGNDGVKASAGAPDPDANGQIDGAQLYDPADNGFINVGTHSSISTLQVPMTITGWFNSNSSSGSRTILGQYLSTAGSQLVKMVRLDGGGLGYFMSTSGGGFQANAFSGNPSINTWHYFAIQVSGTISSPSLSITIDSTTQNFTPSAFSSTPNTSVTTRIGGNQAQTTNEDFSGYIDEIRIASTTRSADWVEAEYKNGINDFNSFGTEVPLASDAWLFYNSSSLNSSTTITSLLLPASDVMGLYMEASPTSPAPLEALAGQTIEWDFAIDPSFMVADTSYYFRLIKSDGTVFDTYTTYPVITLNEDYVAPTSGSITVGSATVSSLTATISGASDSDSGLHATPYRFFNETAGTNSGWQSSTSWQSTSLSENTTYSFYANVRDAAGNISTTTTQTGTTSSSPASGGGGGGSSNSGSSSGNGGGGSFTKYYMTINGDAPTTTSPLVTLYFVAPPQTETILLSATSSFSNSTLVSFASTTTWSLCPTPTCAYKTYTVYARFRDKKGNALVDTSDSIYYSFTPPPLPVPPSLPPATTTPPTQVTSTPPVTPPPLPIVSAPDDSSLSLTLLVTPIAGRIDITEFEAELSISGSAKGQALYEIDWDGDGVYDQSATSNSNRYIFNDKQYSKIGAYMIGARVTKGGFMREDRAIVSVAMPNLSSQIEGSLDKTSWSNNLSALVGEKVSFQFTTIPDLGGEIGERYKYSLDCNSDGTYERVYENTTRTHYIANNACIFLDDGFYRVTLLTEVGNFSTLSYMSLAAGNPEVLPPPSPQEPPESPTTPTLPPITEFPGGNPGGVAVGETYSDTVVHNIFIPTIDTILAATFFGSNIENAARTTTELLKDVTGLTSASLPLSSAAIVAPLSVVAHIFVAPGMIVTFTDMGVILLSSLNQILSFLHLRQRRRYWGTVYDSDTKQPIDPAIVTLIDTKDNKVTEETVTDLYGRFGFLDRVGTFRIETKKTHYRFPSQKIVTETDGIYQNVYHGEDISIAVDNKTLINPNVPMDPEGQDWNQEAKQDYVKIHPNIDLLILYGTKVMLLLTTIITLSFLIADPSLLALASFLVSTLIVVAQTWFLPLRLWGRVVNLPEGVQAYIVLHPRGLPQATVGRSRISKDGRYFLKCAPGNYSLNVINKNTGEILYAKDVDVGRVGVVSQTIKLATVPYSANQPV